MAIPIIDERIKTIGPGTLRKMDALKLRALRDLLVIQVNDEPLAVMIPYEMYLEMQQAVVEGQKAIATKMAEFEDAFGPLIEQPNGGADHNPDMVYSKHSYIDPANERRQVPRSGSTMDMPPIDQIHEKDSGWLPPKAPDPKGIVVPYDDIAIALDEPHCDHCGKEGADRTCGECFMAGHRNVANCQQCAEKNSN